MIRIFNLYVPTRTLVLLAGDAAIILGSFELAIRIRFGGDSSLVFSDDHGLWKILGVASLALLGSHFLELHDLSKAARLGEVYYRILTLLAVLAIFLAGISYCFPSVLIKRNVLLTALCILTMAWLLWRRVFEWLVVLPALRERVYLLGSGDRAQRILEAIRTRSELGMDLVGWTGEASEEALGSMCRDLGNPQSVDRIIVALKDRRSAMPVNELLKLRMLGIRIDEGTSLLEKVSGQIELDDLRPSWLLFSDGFRFSQPHQIVQQSFSTLLALIVSILTLPLIPIIVMLIKLDSPGEVLYRQKRVGLRGRVFNCYKFRSMRADAEADSGPTWARDDDPRITKTGRFLRRSRLDEIPQLWNVLRGDMEFVGPRPERPEFVELLNREIPYYQLRESIPPGITGWAQVCYKYGNTLEDSQEKLRYDLYYIKNRSFGFDMMILLRTIKTVLLEKGS